MGSWQHMSGCYQGSAAIKSCFGTIIMSICLWIAQERHPRPCTFRFQLEICINIALNEGVLDKVNECDIYWPFFAGAPPTIRLFCTSEYPHPSSGVSRRPLGIVLCNKLRATPPWFVFDENLSSISGPFVSSGITDFVWASTSMSLK